MVTGNEAQVFEAVVFTSKINRAIHAMAIRCMGFLETDDLDMYVTAITNIVMNYCFEHPEHARSYIQAGDLVQKHFSPETFTHVEHEGPCVEECPP